MAIDFDFVSDVLGGLFGGTQERAGENAARTAEYAGQLQYRGLQDSLGFLQNESNINRGIAQPYVNAGYGALAEMQRQTGLPVTANQPQQYGPPQGQQYGGQQQYGNGAPLPPPPEYASGGGGGLGIAGAVGLAALRNENVRNSIASRVGLGGGGGLPSAAGAATGSLGPGGAAGAAPGPLSGGTEALPGYDFGPTQAPSLSGTIGSIGSGSGPFSGASSIGGNLRKFGGAATAGVLTGLTTQGSLAKKSGAGAGAAAGAVLGQAAIPIPFIGGAIGSFLGGKIGGAIGGQLRSRNERYGVQYDPRTGTLFDETGLRLNDGDLRDYQNSLNPSADYEGHYELPGASLDGHKLLIDPQGNIVSGTNGRDLTGAIANVNAQGGPVGLAWNGQNVTNTGGGHAGYGQYDPSAYRAPQQQPTYGIPSGEGPGGSLGGTQTIAGVDGQPIDVSGQANQQQAQGGRYGAFEASPGYNWLYDETMRGVLGNSSALGGIDSGNTRRTLQNRAAGLAAQDYNNYYNRVAGIASLGAGQGNTLINAGTNLANNSASLNQNAFANLGNSQIAAGASRASGVLSGANTRNQTIGSIAEFLFDRYA